jgi:hypothetical protein
VRGGLDDALDKLARRDELRRRAAGETTGTPPAVQELAEAIATVVGRNPKLAVTVGVEGAGDPVLLHFAFEDGLVQVNVDNSVAARVAEAAPTTPKHADFDLEPEPAYPATPAYAPEAGQETRRISYDDRDRYDPGTGYTTSAYGDETPTTATPAYSDDVAYADPVASDNRYDRHRRYDDDFTSPGFFPSRNAGPASRESAFPTADTSAPAPHPFAATPPPQVPPQTTRRVHAEQHRAPEEPSAAQRAAATGSAQPGAGRSVPIQPMSGQPRSAQPGSGQSGSGQFGSARPMSAQPVSAQPVSVQPVSAQPVSARSGSGQPAQAAQRGMPTPLPKPIPLKVDSEETELAAKRLSALLRDNPSLLQQAPPD